MSELLFAFSVHFKYSIFEFTFTVVFALFHFFIPSFDTECLLNTTRTGVDADSAKEFFALFIHPLKNGLFRINTLSSPNRYVHYLHSLRGFRLVLIFFLLFSTQLTKLFILLLFTEFRIQFLWLMELSLTVDCLDLSFE